MQLAVASEHLADAAVCVDDHWAKDLTPEEREAAERVVDLDAAELTCPACMTTFRSGPNRCPGCGLRLG